MTNIYENALQDCDSHRAELYKRNPKDVVDDAYRLYPETLEYIISAATFPGEYVDTNKGVRFGYIQGRMAERNYGK